MRRNSVLWCCDCSTALGIFEMIAVIVTIGVVFGEVAAMRVCETAEHVGSGYGQDVGEIC